MKYHATVDIDLDDLFEEVNAESLMDHNIDLTTLFGKWHYSWVKMDQECKKRMAKDENDDDWDEKLYDEYKDLEKEVTEEILKNVYKVMEYYDD